MKNLFLIFVVLFFAVGTKAQNPFFDFRVTELSNSLTTLLLNRYPDLPKAQREKYLIELKAIANFKGIETTGERVEKIRAKLLPVLQLFKRENYTEIAVFDASRPFVATYKEFVLILSSGTIQTLTDEQLRGVIAHELAHEVFMKEFESAMKSNDFTTMQSVEIKCDILAAQVSLILNENPLSVVCGVEALRKWLVDSNIEVKAHDSHPEPDVRRKAIKEFLKNLKK